MDTDSRRARRIAAHLIFFDNRLWPRPVVGVDAQGTITSIEVDCADVDSRCGVEFYSGILIPPFVNAHCHLELSHLKGAIPSGGGFVQFARSMGSCRTGSTPEERIEAMTAADMQMWREGVGAVGDISNGAASFDVKRQSSIRYTTFIEQFGLQSQIEDVLSVLDAARNAGLRAAITPHSTYSLSREAFAAACRCDNDNMGDGQMPLSIHFMESADEQELFSRRGSMWQWYRERGWSIDFEEFLSPAGRLTAQIPSHRSVLLVHDCFVDAETIQRIESNFEGRVTWVLCPESNDYISGVHPPAEMLMRLGVNVALGTDSYASCRTLSMVEAMRMLPEIPLEKRLKWATTSPAAALDDPLFGDDELRVGATQGLVLLDGVDMGRMELTLASRARRLV